MTGITRSAAAKIIAEHFGTSAVHVGGTYDTYTVEDDTGRKWKAVSDASIQCQSRGERTASRLYAVEVVSPICKYKAYQVEWKPMAGGDKEMQEILTLLGGVD